MHRQLRDRSPGSSPSTRRDLHRVEADDGGVAPRRCDSVQRGHRRAVPSRKLEGAIDHQAHHKLRSGCDLETILAICATRPFALPAAQRLHDKEACHSPPLRHMNSAINASLRLPSSSGLISGMLSPRGSWSGYARELVLVSFSFLSMIQGGGSRESPTKTYFALLMTRS